jgi:hypothetical protein
MILVLICFLLYQKLNARIAENVVQGWLTITTTAVGRFTAFKRANKITVMLGQEVIAYLLSIFMRDNISSKTTFILVVDNRLTVTRSRAIAGHTFISAVRRTNNVGIILASITTTYA